MHCEIQDPKSRNCNREFVDNEFDTRMRKVLKRIVHLSSRVPSNQLLCQSKTENGIRVRVKSFLLCHIGPHILCHIGPQILFLRSAAQHQSGPVRHNICGPMWHNKKDFTLDEQKFRRSVVETKKAKKKKEKRLCPTGDSNSGPRTWWTHALTD